MFSWRCTSNECEYIFECYTPNRETIPVCRLCGTACEKVWMGKAPNVVDDSVPGGFTVENLDREPRRFYSRSEFRDELRARGLTSPLVDGIGSSRFRHLGDPDGSDKARTVTDPTTGRAVTRSSRWV